MNVRTWSLRTLWPWLVIAALVALGPFLGSCTASVATATPTPTKTPRAEAVVPATPASTDAPLVEPQTPTPAPSETAAPSTTATITPTLTASVTPVLVTSTPRAVAPTSVPNLAAQMSSPDYGVQAFLWWRPEVADRDIGLVKEAGFTWVKQFFAWQDIEGAGKGQFDWSKADRVVDQVQKAGLKLIVRVGADPDRPFWAGDPPASAGNFANFLAAVASRYHGRIQAYQIWNEPNLAREWGKKQPDPAGYVRLLRIAYNSIKSIDPGAIVVTAGMAPTTQDNDQAMPDMRFYQGMYDAMGGQSNGYFDMLGVHGAGYAVSPETDPQAAVNDPRLHNNDPSAADLLRVYAFRHIEDVRALMVRNGDTNKRVVILEFGWTTDDRPDSPYFWHGAGAGITQTVQGCYLLGALKYAQQNWRPWIALMNMIYLPDVQWTKNDEQYYWSIIGPGYPDLYLRPAYVIVKNYLTTGVVDDNCPQYK